MVRRSASQAEVIIIVPRAALVLALTVGLRGIALALRWTNAMPIGSAVAPYTSTSSGICRPRDCQVAMANMTT
jgi:hypothetical protein